MSTRLLGRISGTNLNIGTNDLSRAHMCCVLSRVDYFEGVCVPLTRRKGNFVLFYCMSALCIMLVFLLATLHAVDSQISVLLIESKESVSVSLLTSYATFPCCTVPCSGLA